MVIVVYSKKEGEFYLYRDIQDCPVPEEVVKAAKTCTIECGPYIVGWSDIKKSRRGGRRK